MPKFRKKPVVIEARQITGVEEMPQLAAWCGGRFGDDGEFAPAVYIDTLEGTMSATDGDWIIKGVNGEFYPCKPDIFAKTYEPHADIVLNEVPSRGGSA